MSINLRLANSGERVSVVRGLTLYKIGIVGLAILLFFIMACSFDFGNPDFTYGAIPDTEKDWPDKEMYTFENRVDLPPFFEVTGLPPIGSQGPQGSCVGWAVSTAVTQRHGNISDRVSPAWIYGYAKAVRWEPLLNTLVEWGWLKGGCLIGSSMPAALRVITLLKSKLNSEFPYNFDVCYTFAEVKGEGKGPRIKQWGPLFTSVNNIKNELYSGGAAPFWVKITDEFSGYRIDDSNRTYDVQGESWGYHAMCLVGWNDAYITDTTEPGAFKFCNSWGTGWQYDGYWWLSYSAVRSAKFSDMRVYHIEM